MGDKVFDSFFSSNVQYILNNTYQQSTVQAAGTALLALTGKPAVGHSQGGPLATLLADARPNLTSALILLEPTGSPFQENVFANNSARAWGLTRDGNRAARAAGGRSYPNRRVPGSCPPESGMPVGTPKGIRVG
jgi:pimeloyl-ACP methyl ester carboxylesterase